MDFAFSEEQEMLRDQARSFLGSKFPESKIVEVSESDDRSGEQYSWNEMAELGWMGLSVAEDHGGSGFGFLEEAVLFEEMGRALYPGPYFATVALALPVLVSAPDALNRVAAGDSPATLAWLEEAPGLSLSLLDELGTKAERSNDHWTLTGEKHFVVGAEIEGTIAVVAGAGDGVGMWAVDPSSDGVTVETQSTMDPTRPLSRVTLSGAPATLLVEPGAADEALRQVRLRAQVALALEAVGVAARVFELAAEHAKSRQQFDRPIGVYQAVSHQIADMYMGSELARSITYWAAWCVAEGDDQAEIAAAAAKARASEAAVAACESSIQVHGGIGFTWEHILHRYYKRAQWIAAFDGFPATHRRTIAAKQREVVAAALLD